MIVVGEGIFRVEEVLSLKWRNPHRRPSTDEEGSGPQTQQLDRLWNAA